MKATHFAIEPSDGNWRIVVVTETFEYVEDDSVTTSVRITEDYCVMAGELESAIVKHGAGNLMGLEDLNVYLSTFPDSVKGA